MRERIDPRVRLLVELADDTRYAVVERLEEGPASASELGERLGVAPTRLANHLQRLRDAGLVRVTRQGRLAVYELAEPGLRELLSILNGLRRTATKPVGPAPLAASCYDHLSGVLGVALMDHLVRQQALHERESEGALELGPAADTTFGALGVTIPGTRPRRMLAFSCMDSHVGRPHLGGLLGAHLAASLRQRDWVRPAERVRRLELTETGARGLRELRIDLPTPH